MMMPPKLYIYGAVILASFAIGHEWRDRAADAEISALLKTAAEESQKASESARKIEQLNAEKAVLAATAAALRNQEREVITQTIFEEVIQYVPEPVAADCPVGPDADWLRFHDVAATGDLPGATSAASGSDAGAPQITHRDTLVRVTSNYSTCYEIRDDFISLQAWVTS